jgi:CMP-N,N'-diacetyllegionaminic acid synthase
LICHALIAARGGSKGLKNKNLKKLKRLSLVEIAIKNALSSGVFSEIFCSSDSKKILKLTKKKATNILRPDKYSNDNATSESVVKHYLHFLKKNNIKYPEIMFFFQPTSPFIKVETIKKMIKIFKKDTKVNSIISVYKVPNKYHYVNQRKIFNNSEMKFIFKKKKNILKDKTNQRFLFMEIYIL